MDAPPLTPLAAALLHVPPPERALLVGCGNGEPALLLTREFPAARVRAVDASAAQIRAAQAKVGLDPEGRIAFKQAEAGHLPYPDRFFDLVAQVEGRTMSDEIVRVLRNGGHLVLAPPETAHFARRVGERLHTARLRRAGFVAVCEQSVGGGKFTVARLDARR